MGNERCRPLQFETNQLDRLCSDVVSYRIASYNLVHLLSRFSPISHPESDFVFDSCSFTLSFHFDLSPGHRPFIQLKSISKQPNR